MNIQLTPLKLLKKVAISQSNYIPWKGYFDSIALVDEFVLYDDMQYTKRDWRNRNKIKTSNGLKWLTIPVEVKGKFLQKIKETKVSDKSWAKKHLESLKHNYSKANCFKEALPFVEELYVKAGELEMLSDINYLFLSEICSYLNIDTKISFSSDYRVDESIEKTDKLVDLCIQIKATDYYTGPAAKDYIDEELFLKQGISVSYFDYSGYRDYEQLHGEFDHGVSILDLIFSKGEESKRYLNLFAT